MATISCSICPTCWSEACEPPLLQEIWDANPLLRQYLGTVDNPALIVYRVRPERVRFMREWALDYHEVPAEAIG